MTGQYRLHMATPENDFPMPWRVTSIDVEIRAVDSDDAAAFGAKLLREWGLAGVFQLIVTDLAPQPEPGVHAPDCGLRGSGLDKVCTCHVGNNSYTLACGCTHVASKDLVVGACIICPRHGWVPVNGVPS